MATSTASSIEGCCSKWWKARDVEEAAHHEVWRPSLLEGAAQARIEKLQCKKRRTSERDKDEDRSFNNARLLHV